MFYPLAKPCIAKEEEDAVLKVLRSGILSIGPKIKEFEKNFAKKIGTKYACAVSSGTAGLHLSMIAAGISKGDEVITTPFSFVASANSIQYVGARPMFVDIDPLTYNIDPDKIEQKITKRTKAILVVHIFGQSVDMDPIIKIAKKHNLKIIEDACESICATYKGKNVGTFGESAVFAFYPNKQLTTGEGGMIITNKKEIYEKCCSLRNQGRASNMKWLDHQYLGYNYRMDEMSAAIGVEQLKKIENTIKERARIASLYQKHLGAYRGIVQVPHISSNCIHTWFVYVVKLLNFKIDRDEVIDKLEKKGIYTKPYLPSIHLFSFYKKQYRYNKGDFPVSENVSKSSLALPFYIGLKEKDIKNICKILIQVIGSCRKNNMANKKPKVVLIGGTGFIGSHLAQKLWNKNESSLVVVHKSKQDHSKKLPGVIFKRINLKRSCAQLEIVVKDADYIVILTQPNKFIIQNIIKSLYRANSLKKIVYLSSILVYPESKNKVSEKTKIGPKGEYEQTKVYEETILSEFARKKNKKLCIARPVNIYGNTEDKGIIGKIFSSACSNNPFTIYGTGEQKRDYIYIDDVIDFIEYLIFFNQKKNIEVFNLGTSEAINVKNLIKLISEITGIRIKIKNAKQRNEKKNIVSDSSRILKLSSKNIQNNLKNGLKRTSGVYANL